MRNINYFLEKNKQTGEIVYIEYDKINGYKITPKTKKEDAIEVNKIVFVNPSLREKLIKKKIDKEINRLLNFLSIINDEDDSGEGIKLNLMDAERLKLKLINEYIKYLGNTYTSLTLKKLQIIINQLRIKLYLVRDKSYEMNNTTTYEPEEPEENRGRGR